MEWKDVISKIVDIAPVAGGFFGAPGIAVGVAVKAIAKSFGLKEDAPPEDIMAALKGDPEAQLKLFTAQSLYNLEVMKLETETMRIELADVQNARSRQIEHEKMTGKSDTNLYVLAWVVVCGFFFLTGLLLYESYQGRQISDSSGALFMLLGGLVAGFSCVLQYFFGSSKSSSDKSAIMGQMRKTMPKQ